MRSRANGGRPASLRVATMMLLATAANASAQFAEEVDVIHDWVGENADDRLGRIVRAIGDIDGDGVIDIAVAAPNNDEGGEEAGKAYLYSGADGELIREHIGEPGDNMGNEIASVGDLDGDDVPDYLMGAPSGLDGEKVNGPGRAFLFSGADGTLIHEWAGEALGDRLGRAVAGAGNVTEDGVGDIDGDGVPDVLISAPFHDSAGTDAGRVYVYSGADLDKTIHVLDGRAAREEFGHGLGGLGDLDDDGRADFGVGAPQGTSGRGRAYVFSGSDGELLFPRLVPRSTGAVFGLFFVSGPGDVDGDGTPDVYVADFADSANGANTGRAYVFSGVDGEEIHVFTGEFAGEGLGIGRGCGDVNGDGHGDLLVCAFRSNVGASVGGRAFIFSGADGEILRVITGTVAGAFLGWSATCAGDANGDGAPDYAITAPNTSTNGTADGRAYLIAGDVFPCPADVDVSGSVGFDDLLAILAAWGPCEDCREDLDGDREVGLDDLLAVLASWGPCPGAARGE
jgi:hypothetical protein